MTEDRAVRVLNLIATIDAFKRQVERLTSRFTVQAAETYGDIGIRTMEILAEALISSSCNMQVELLTTRYRILRAFIEENPGFSLSESEIRMDPTEEFNSVVNISLRD